MSQRPLPIDRKAPRDRIQLDETSWVDVVRSFAPDTGTLFDELHEGMSWQQGHSIREGRKIPNPRLSAGLSNRATEQYGVLHFTRLSLEARYRIKLQGVGLVLYRNGRDSVGFHSDDELRYLEKTVIGGLVLGAARPVAFKPRAEGEITTVVLGGGDLYVMGGRAQADWLHAVPKVEGAGPRIGAIWRWTSKLGPPSSSPTRFVADAPRKRHWR